MEANRKRVQVHMIPKEEKNSWDCNRTKLLKLVHDVGEAIYKKDSVGFDLDRWIKENL